jgi:hypothetical protein
MSRDDFDLGDFGDIEEPSFPEDEFLPPEEAPVARPQRNVVFLVIAILLVLLFLFGLFGITSLVISNQATLAAYTQTAGAVYLTNTAVAVALNATNTANAWTKTPTPTQTPTDTPTPTPTETFTPSPTETPTPTIDVEATNTSLTMTAQAALEMRVIDITNTAVAQETLLAMTNVAATLTAQFGSGGAVPPEQQTQTAIALLTQAAQTGTIIVQLPTTVSPFETAKPTRIQPTKLPNGGFFDDVSTGKASPSSLAVVGFAALGLVGVIVVARRLRVRT